MTIHVYRNTDANAPALRGNVAGDLINLLDKCLVSGYGSKDPAGWSKPFTGTNVAVFRQGAGGMRYLRVDDTGTLTSLNRARVVGYETMSDVNTGTGAFPSETQISGGLYWFLQYNATTGGASARNWCVIADESFFYAFWDTAPDGNDTQKTYSTQCYFFGDFIPYGSADDWNTVIGGGNASGDWNSNTVDSQYVSTTLYSATLNSRLWGLRRYDGIGASASGIVFLWGGNYSNNNGAIGYGGVSYPNPVDGRIVTAEVEVGDVTSGSVRRGKMPGMISQCHNLSYIPPRYSVFDGTADLEGNTYIVYNQSQVGFFINITDWGR